MNLLILGDGKKKNIIKFKIMFSNNKCFIFVLLLLSNSEVFVIPLSQLSHVMMTISQRIGFSSLGLER